jgi:hypothetical protein
MTLRFLEAYTKWGLEVNMKKGENKISIHRYFPSRRYRNLRAAIKSMFQFKYLGPVFYSISYMLR